MITSMIIWMFMNIPITPVKVEYIYLDTTYIVALNSNTEKIPSLCDNCFK